MSHAILIAHFRGARPANERAFQHLNRFPPTPKYTTARARAFVFLPLVPLFPPHFLPSGHHVLGLPLYPVATPTRPVAFPNPAPRRPPLFIGSPHVAGEARRVLFT